MKYSLLLCKSIKNSFPIECLSQGSRHSRKNNYRLLTQNWTWNDWKSVKEKLRSRKYNKRGGLKGGYKNQKGCGKVMVMETRKAMEKAKSPMEVEVEIDLRKKNCTKTQWHTINTESTRVKHRRKITTFLESVWSSQSERINGRHSEKWFKMGIFRKTKTENQTMKNTV